MSVLVSASETFVKSDSLFSSSQAPSRQQRKNSRSLSLEYQGPGKTRGSTCTK
jgi:hypothetical protein